MRTLLIALSAIAAAGVSGGAAAATSASALKTLVLERGRCAKLIAAGRDFSHDCTGLSTNEEFVNGRNGFTFIIGKMGTVSFSGAGPDQVHLDADHVTQPVDRVVFTLLMTGATPNVIKAVGACRFANPFKGSTTTICEASTSKGPFSARFVSDGKEPEVKQF
jgi:hypothetical protein